MYLNLCVFFFSKNDKCFIIVWLCFFLHVLRMLLFFFISFLPDCSISLPSNSIYCYCLPIKYQTFHCHEMLRKDFIFNAEKKMFMPNNFPCLFAISTRALPNNCHIVIHNLKSFAVYHFCAQVHFELFAIYIYFCLFMFELMTSFDSSMIISKKLPELIPYDNV